MGLEISDLVLRKQGKEHRLNLPLLDFLGVHRHDLAVSA